MSFYDLATQAEEEARKDEATTMSSIAFLPAQVGAVKAALKGLGKKKGQWNLEILEDDDGSTVRFEDALEIKVTRDHWDAFQGIFGGALSNQTYLDLSTIAIHDSTEETEEQTLLEQRLAAIQEKVIEKLGEPAIQKASDVTSRWLGRFGTTNVPRTFEGALVELPLLEGASDRFTESLTEDCQEDLGQLEILLGKLNDFSTIRECAYLAGVRAFSRYAGISMVFEAHTDWSNVNSFSIAIHDAEVADAVEEAVMGVRRIGNVFYPRGGQMDGRLGGDNLVDMIRETIDGLAVPEDELAVADEGDEDEEDS